MNRFFIPNISLEFNNIELELKSNSITVRIEIFTGVLTQRTFTGEDCYLQLLAFFSQIQAKDNLQVKLILS
jgi:hypothetical protein